MQHNETVEEGEEDRFRQSIGNKVTKGLEMGEDVRYERRAGAASAKLMTICGDFETY